MLLCLHLKYLFYSNIDTEYSNIYNTIILKSNNYNTKSPWYSEYTSNGLLGNTSNIDLKNFLSNDFYYNYYNDYTSIQYNITNGVILKDYF